MYTRRARFLFCGPAALVTLACACVAEAAADWVDARALLCEVPEPLRQEYIVWADLCVLLDEAPPPAEKVCQRWRIGDPDDPATRNALIEQLRGAVGGLKLLAASDKSGP